MKDFIIDITTEDSKNSPYLQLFKDWMNKNTSSHTFVFDSQFYGFENGRCCGGLVYPNTKCITLKQWYNNYYLLSPSPVLTEQNPSNEKEIDVVLDVLYALRQQDEFYFKSYGKVFIESLLKKINQ